MTRKLTKREVLKGAGAIGLSAFAVRVAAAPAAEAITPALIEAAKKEGKVTFYTAMLFGVHPATAVGTDLLYAAATKTGGSLVHGFARSIDWRVVGRLATGSIPATILTLAVLSHFNLSGDAARNLITLVLSVALFATAFVLVFGKSIVAVYRARVSELDPHKTAVSTIVAGAVLGCLVSISSVGAGALGVIALVMLYPQMPMAKIVGSDIAHDADG